MHAHEELLGADFFEHDIHHPGVGVSRAVSVLQHYHKDVDVTIERKGGNKGKKQTLKQFGKVRGAAKEKLTSSPGKMTNIK